MKITHFLLLIALGSGLSCKRKLSPAEVKVNLEKAMANYLKKEQEDLSSTLRFEMVDVDYFEDREFYDCEFKVRLLRDGGKDTTGVIKSKITKDFSKVTKRW